MPTIDVMRLGHYSATRMSQSGESEVTPLLTIDSLQWNGCNLMKIDVEGMDYDLLIGAADTIARTRPYVYMEAKKGLSTQQAIAGLQELFAAEQYDISRTAGKQVVEDFLDQTEAYLRERNGWAVPQSRGVSDVAIQGSPN